MNLYLDSITAVNITEKDPKVNLPLDIFMLKRLVILFKFIKHSLNRGRIFS